MEHGEIEIGGDKHGLTDMIERGARVVRLRLIMSQLVTEQATHP